MARSLMHSLPPMGALMSDGEQVRCGDRVRYTENTLCGFSHVAVKYPDGSFNLLGSDVLYPPSGHGMTIIRREKLRPVCIYMGVEYILYTAVIREIAKSVPDWFEIHRKFDDGTVTVWAEPTDLRHYDSITASDIAANVFSAVWGFDVVSIRAIKEIAPEFTDDYAQHWQRAFHRRRGEVLDDHARSLSALRGDIKIMQGRRYEG